MKNKSSILLLLCVAVLAFAGLTAFKTAQPATNKYIYMRVVEKTSGVFESGITIIHEDNTKEKIELKNLGLKYLSINVEVLNQTINKISNKGYKLVSVSSNPGSGGAHYFRDYIFEKE